MLSLTLVSLVISCSALRIQQKEKSSASCNQIAGTGAQDACNCFLQGFRDGNIGSCTVQEQASAALKAGEYVNGCIEKYSPLTGWIYNPLHVDTYNRKNSALAACMRGSESYATSSTQSSPTTPTGNSGNYEDALISTRALVNPSGLVPDKLIDPIVRSVQVMQDQMGYLAEKSDAPGSPPFGVCLGSATYTTTRISLCDENTNTFDGFGMCCSNAADGSYNPSSVAEPKRFQSGTQNDRFHNEASCYLRNIDHADCIHAGASHMVHWSSGSIGTYCTCNVKMTKCMANGSRCTDNDCGQPTGGKGSRIVKEVKICDSSR